MRRITYDSIKNYENYLVMDEKASSTCKKYVHDVKVFKKWSDNKKLDKNLILAYKYYLSQTYSPASVNSVLSSLNSYFGFCEWGDFKVKLLKLQKHIFLESNRQLSQCEYFKLLDYVKLQDKRLYYIMQTICSTGIRISELCYITVDAVKNEQAIVNCKGKLRIVILPGELCKMLMAYIQENKIQCGCVFITKSGKPIDRSNIWSSMKRMCSLTDIPTEKVFPHNLRHLFARTYYNKCKDVVRLADILGHTNINTTRIYTMESGETHKNQRENLGLLHSCFDSATIVRIHNYL